MKVWNTEDIWGIVLELDPMLKAQAAKQAYKGADRDDLLQDLRLHAFHSIQKCQDRQALLLYVELCVSYRALEFSARERWDKRLVPLESEGEDDTERYTVEIRDEEADERFSWSEYGIVLRGVLTEAEYRLLFLFLDGYTYVEMAKLEGITRQTASNRLKEIWNKLLPHLIEFLRA